MLEGFPRARGRAGVEPGDIDYLVHGTTIAINTVIQRNGATLGLLVTAGFGDVLEIQRCASRARSTSWRPARCR